MCSVKRVSIMRLASRVMCHWVVVTFILSRLRVDVWIVEGVMHSRLAPFKALQLSDVLESFSASSNSIMA